MDFLKGHFQILIYLGMAACALIGGTVPLAVAYVAALMVAGVLGVASLVAVLAIVRLRHLSEPARADARDAMLGSAAQGNLRLTLAAAAASWLALASAGFYALPLLHAGLTGFCLVLFGTALVITKRAQKRLRDTSQELDRV